MNEKEKQELDEALAAIAEGGEFDVTEAIKLLAKKLVSIGVQVDKVRSVSSTPGGKK